MIGIFKYKLSMLLFTVLQFTACRMVTEPSHAQVILDQATVADMFGNHDGLASTQELTDLAAYAGVNRTAWCVTNFPFDYKDKYEIPCREVQSAVQGSHTTPYPGEQALRTAKAGVSIRTPYIAVAVLRFDRQIVVQQYYRAPGPLFADRAWTPMIIRP